MDQARTKGIAFAICGFMFLSFADSILKYLGAEYSVFFLGFWNGIFGLGALLTYSLLKNRGFSALISKFHKLQIIRAVFAVGNFLLFFYALIHLPIAYAYALAFTTPFVTAGLSVILLKESLTRPRILSIIAGFLGVIIILRPDKAEISFAAIAVLIAVLMLASQNIIARKIGKTEPWPAFAFYPLVLLIPICLLGSLEEQRLLPLDTLLLFAASGILSVGGNILLAQAFVIAPAALVSSFHYSQFVWALLLGYLVFQDTLALSTLFGAVIITASGIYLIRKEWRSAAF